MKKYDVLVSHPDSTVVAEYNLSETGRIDYQSENDLEKDFIRNLKEQGYEYLNIHDETQLKINLRKQIEKLNGLNFSDNEWNNFFNQELASKNIGILDKTKLIQNDEIINFKTDKNKSVNIKVIDKTNIHKNTLQVINQYKNHDGTHNNRYDVTILVNGLPMIHIELKKRGNSIKDAFNQIKRYERESFWAEDGLFQYVQLYVISNGTNTKYYSNTIREDSIEKNLLNNKKDNQNINTFEFTSYWSDSRNNPIKDLVDFTKTFFARHTILNILTKFCVFTVDKKLLVMRPYQIVATEKILDKVKATYLNKFWGKENSGGYVWHTTGSGKTLTSFKTAQLLRQQPEIEKILFVVDRKDLDYQTIKEYNKYEKDCVSENKSARELHKILNSNHKDNKLTVTTIQKLSRFVKNTNTSDIYNKKTVIIYDECHRSQFGSMHQEIKRKFKQYSIFGFTGTPIFVDNQISNDANLKTTEQVFGYKLHTYNIQDAIRDDNVLPFKIDYMNTIYKLKDANDREVKSIDSEKALNDPRRIEKISNYILDNFDQKTKRDPHAKIEVNRQKGFNSIFATSSIEAAKLYYTALQKINKTKLKPISIAIIYSYAANEELNNDSFEDEDFDNNKLDISSRDFLENAIKDYNNTFKVNFDSSGDSFQNYYKDIAHRTKNREIDLLIVVGMFLTGFDAKTLNTLWVDKTLQLHGLMQAFSRTNRILNSVKTFGQIVCFRDLQDNVNKTILLYGNKDANGLVILKTFKDYYDGYTENGTYHEGYKSLIKKLKEEYSLPMAISSEKAKKDFITLFNKILRIENILSSFDEFENLKLLNVAETQDYESEYHTIREQIQKYKEEHPKETINDDIEFEIELIKQVEINIDYILDLIKNNPMKLNDANFKDKISKAVQSSMSLRNINDLIAEFIEKINIEEEIDVNWSKFFKTKREEELKGLIQEYKLKYEETMKLIEDIFMRGKINFSEIDKIMPSTSRFSLTNGNEKAIKKDEILNAFEKYIERFSII